MVERGISAGGCYIGYKGELQFNASFISTAHQHFPLNRNMCAYTNTHTQTYPLIPSNSQSGTQSSDHRHTESSALDFLTNALDCFTGKHGKADFPYRGTFANRMLAEVPPGFVIYVLILFNAWTYGCICAHFPHLGCLWASSSFLWTSGSPGVWRLLN